MTAPDPLTLLAALVQAGRDGEGAVQALVAQRLAGCGCLVETLAYEPARVPVRGEFAQAGAMKAGPREALIGRLAGRGGGRSVVLFAHPDSETFRDERGWRSDPFVGTVEQGRLHGWGVADDLAGVAAMVAAVEALAAQGVVLAGDVLIASTPSKRHARGVAAVLEHLAPPDAAVYLHPAESGAGMGEIKACTPGLIEFRLDLAGIPPETAEPGHAPYAHRASNPAQAAALLVARLMALDAERAGRVRHRGIEAALGRATNILIARLESGVDGARNRVPASARIEGAISFPPGEAPDAVIGELERAIGATDGSPKPELTVLSGVSGAELPEGHPLFACVAGAIGAETGLNARVNGVHTASDIRVPMLQKGIPTVGLGPLCGDLTQNGRSNEWVDIEDYRRCVKVLVRALKDWCGTPVNQTAQD